MRLPGDSHAQRYLHGEYAAYTRAFRLPSSTNFMVEAAQPAGEFRDPPVAELVLACALSPGLEQSSDFGRGRFVDEAPVGAFFLMPPNAETDIRIHTPHVIRGWALAVEPFREGLREIRRSEDPFDFGRLHFGHFEDRNLRMLFDLMWLRASEETVANRLLLDGVTMAILSELTRLADRPLTRVGGLTPLQLKRCVDYLHEHLAQDISIIELAAVAKLSEFHFARQFKASTGISPGALLRQLRCERAQQLMMSTQMTIADISYSVGYESQQSFTRMFRAQTGASPSKWRRERRS